MPPKPEGKPPERLQSLSQRSRELSAGLSRPSASTPTRGSPSLSRGRFTPKVVARRSKEDRDSTAPAESKSTPVELPGSTASTRGGSSLRGRGGALSSRGRGRGRGRFEPVASAAVGPLAAPSGVDPRGGSRYPSPGFDGPRPAGPVAPGAFDLGALASRVKSETPGPSSGRSSREATAEIEDDTRIDMTNRRFDMYEQFSEFFPVRLDHREDDDDDEAEEAEVKPEVKPEAVSEAVDSEGVKIKAEPLDQPSQMSVDMSVDMSAETTPVPVARPAVAQAGVGLEAEQIKELRRIARDHRAIAQEFNMKSLSVESGTESGDPDELPEIEKRLCFLQFPLLMPQFTQPVKTEPDAAVQAEQAENPPTTSTESKDDDDIMIVDDPSTVPSTTTTPTPNAPSGPMDPLPEGLIGKLRLHKSGALTMVIGNITMKVSQGTECSFLQDIVALDDEENRAYLIGQVSKKLVLSPDFD